MCRRVANYIYLHFPPYLPGPSRLPPSFPVPEMLPRKIHKACAGPKQSGCSPGSARDPWELPREEKGPLVGGCPAANLLSDFKDNVLLCQQQKVTGEDSVHS